MGRAFDLLTPLAMSFGFFKHKHVIFPLRHGQTRPHRREKPTQQNKRETDVALPFRYSHYAMPAELTGGYNAHQSFATSSSHKLNGSLQYPPPSGAGSSHLRYDAYAPPRKAAPSTAPSSSPVKPGLFLALLSYRYI